MTPPLRPRLSTPSRAGGFQSNYTDSAPRGLGEVLAWKIDAARNGLPPDPQTPTPVVAPDLKAKRSMGVHWGTFNLTDEALDEPPRALAKARTAQGVADDAFFVLAIGQTRQLPRRTAP